MSFWATILGLAAFAVYIGIFLWFVLSEDRTNERE